MTLRVRQDRFIETFDQLGGWKERFEYLIELGGCLPELPEHLKCPQTLIQGCHSRTYFIANIDGGKVHIQGWSNASVPAGLIAAMREIFEGISPEEIRTTEINFHTKTKLCDNLTELRKASLLEMIDRVKRL